MKSSASSEKYEVVADINMIPFIDIALVLLIIFMVMTPYLVKKQIKIDPPKARTPGSNVEQRRLIKIEVTREGSYYINGESTAAAAIDTGIKRLLKDPENQQVIISADKAVPFECAVRAMDAAKHAGAVKLGVEIRQDTGSGAPSHHGTR